MLTVYGSSACSACKTFLQMAKAQGHDPKYLLIDQDAKAAELYGNLELSSRELPAVVYANKNLHITSAGLRNGMGLLKTIKETSNVQ